MNDALNEPLESTILSSWEKQCAQRPESIAIEFEDQSWTYDRLNEVADWVAHWLLQDGLAFGESVGLCVDRSADAIAVMLGVMKAGGVFVPLDPEYPAERLGYMVEDAGATRVIGHQHYQDAIGSKLEQNGQIRWIDAVKIGEASTDSETDSVSLPEIHADSMAYIMYTSGSTGKPKGVEIQHSALTAYCDADIECYRLTAGDRTLQFSTLCFDIAIEEIFPPLLTGGTVVVRPRERSSDKNELTSIVDRYRITAIHLATAYWHQWVDLMVATDDTVPESLRLVIATGEKVSVEHYSRWNTICHHDVLWCNAYGPTETTVTATVFIPDQDFSAPHMPIGKPLKRYTAFILDDELNEVQDGQTGHLYIGGPALAKGYHHRDDLTQRAFADVAIDGTSKRLYRTGDLARWLPDGNIDFAGRVDHQIKLGSYRIEPGEIEAVMNQAPGVLESLVTYEEIKSQKYLIAYVATKDASCNANVIADFLRASLPPYMVPSRYAFMPSFPKTINGKIDRDRLPHPELASTTTNDNYIAARNDLEQQFVDLWKEVLNMSDIGIHDDFFLLGGSSLLVTQVITKLTADMDIDMPVRDFFANPTIATLARHLRSTGQIQPDLSDPLLENASDEEQEEADLREVRKRLPIATPQFIVSRGSRLYAVDYRPSSGSSRSPVLLCHPIGHEYTRAYRNLQQLAVALCAAGHHVLRFDYFGTGNSEGECDELTSSTLIQNICDAKDHLASIAESKNVDVVGVRLGALLAASVSPDTFARTVLWDPVINGETMLETFEHLHSQQFVGLTRFKMQRAASSLDQTYGHAMSTIKRESVGGLQMRSLTDQDYVVVSEGSLASPEEQEWLSQQPHRIENKDSIRWNDARYTESAFSSPTCFQQIIDRLQVPVATSARTN